MMSLPGNRRQYRFDEAKLKPGQRKCAMLLMENDFSDKGDRRTQEEIAEEVGVHRTTIHAWNTQDTNFIEYKNYLSANAMNTFLPFVYRKLIDGINNGSMKGIELYLKRIGDMDTRSEVTLNEGSGDDKSFDERKADILARLGNNAGVNTQETEQPQETPQIDSKDVPSNKPLSKDG